jgi:O-antigen/teichoic acid export membrane protein
MSVFNEAELPKRPTLDSVLLMSASLIATIISAGILVLAARESSLSDFAWLVSLLAISALLVTIVDFGSNSFWLIRLSKIELDLSDWKKLAGEKIATGLAVGFVVLLTGVIFGAHSLQVALLFLFQLVQQTLFVYFKVTNRNRVLASATLIDRLAALAASILVFGLPNEDGDLLFIPFLTGSIVSCIISIVFIRKEHLPAIKLTADYSKNWTSTSNFGILSLIGSIRGTDVLVLGLVGGAGQSALYGSVSKWNMPMIVASGALTSVSTPIIARLGLTKSSMRRLAGPILLLTLTLAGAGLIIVFADFFVNMLLGDKYAQSSEILAIVILAGVFLSSNQTLSSWLQALGREATVAKVNIFTTTLQFVLLVPLGVVAGGLGAALALLASQVTLTLCLSVVLFRQTRTMRLGSDLSE